MKRLLLSLLVLMAPAAFGGALPGFHLEKIASVEGFITSLALRDGKELYWSSATGEVYRLEGSSSEEVTKFDTAVEGNAVLLGVTFRGDDLFAHYVAKDHSADVIESVNVESGDRLIVAKLVCDNGNPCPTEHHGGNLTTADDGSIYFGVGDYGTYVAAQNPKSPGGKVYRIAPDNSVKVFAYGFRNPYDMAFDRASGKLIVADNGPVGGDELTFVSEGENHGWPLTYGKGEAVAGTVKPAYVFSETVAPTGLALIARNDPYLSSGILLATYWDKSLFWFDTARNPLEERRLLDTGAREGSGSHKLRPQHDVPQLADSLIDVVQDRDGAIYLATTTAIYRLRTPLSGDANGDGKVDDGDAEALGREILDATAGSYLDAATGNFAASWGADVNRDGVIDARDLVAFGKARAPRSRPVRVK